MSFANPILIECIMADDDGGDDNNNNDNNDDSDADDFGHLKYCQGR